VPIGPAPRAELRPLERRILSLVEAGIDSGEIARRFRRSPEFIDRVITLAQLPRHHATPTRPRVHQLRPIERRVLHWRGEGVTFEGMAPRFRRSPGHLERIAGFAEYKLQHQ
jgi:hypothetical protein